MALVLVELVVVVVVFFTFNLPAHFFTNRSYDIVKTGIDVRSLLENETCNVQVLVCQMLNVLIQTQAHTSLSTVKMEMN